MATSSYEGGTVSTGVVKIKKELDLDPTGQNVIIVEDIIDSGNTLNFLGQYFKDRGAKSVRMVTMLDKPDRREVDVHVDYTGFTIPDQFVVGYGLDYDQKYRNLPYIGVVELDQEAELRKRRASGMIIYALFVAVVLVMLYTSMGKSTTTYYCNQ